MSNWELALRLYVRLLPTGLFVGVGATVLVMVYEWMTGGE